MPTDTIELDLVVPAREPWSGVIRRGQILRLTDLEGQQAIDFLCYDAVDPSERYCATDTVKIPGNLYLGEGSILYSNLARPLMRIVRDTCGLHDTVVGCCSDESNVVRYGKKGQANCRDNFLRALAPHGLGRKDIVSNVNFFMRVPIGPDGAVGIATGHSKPGDVVELLAETDVLVALSNCPQINNPASGFRPTPIRVTVLSRAA